MGGCCRRWGRDHELSARVVIDAASLLLCPAVAWQRVRPLLPICIGLGVTGRLRISRADAGSSLADLPFPPLLHLG